MLSVATIKVDGLTLGDGGCESERIGRAKTCRGEGEELQGNLVEIRLRNGRLYIIGTTGGVINAGHFGVLLKKPGRITGFTE